MSCNTFTYGPIENENARSIDLYISKDVTQDTPLIVLIHGGAWRSEDKSDYKDLALGLTQLGLSVASVNYRLSLKEEGQACSPIQHPDHIIDVGKAVEYLYTSPPSHQYDPKKIYLVGHSAGAHIAAMLLLDTELPYHHYIKGILGVSGIYDIPLLVKTFPSYLDFISQAFGPEQSTHYDASPISKTSTLLQGKTIYIAQSKQDTLINNEQSEVMARHLQAMHAQVILDLTLKGDHYDIMNTDNLVNAVQTMIFT